MIQQFDFFGQAEYPYIILTNPDKTELYSLGLAYDTTVKNKFNSLSDFSFKFPKSIDGGITNIEAYDYLNNKRLVKVENFGYFIILDCQEDSEGAVPIKTVSCQSLEAELIQKRLTSYGGTKPLWILGTQPTESGQTSILYDMIQFAPNWSIGDIDVILLTKFRTFNVSDTNIYNFLMSDVSKAFDCVFIFDSNARTISVKTVENSTTQTDIFLSFDNIVKSSSFSEKSDEITTCLAVYGGGNLNIRSVNPLGSDKIYDFSYYKKPEWMSQGLVNSITNWEILVDDFVNGTNISGQNDELTNYSDTLLTLKNYNAEMILLRSSVEPPVGLAQLQEEYLVLEGVQKVRIQGGIPYDEITIQLKAKQLEITNKEQEIVDKQAQIDATVAVLIGVNNIVSFDLNFTPAQILELDNFIYQNTYQNENIIKTDSMDNVEIQEAQQELYDQAISVLNKVAQPRYEIQMDSANYVSLAEFSIFTSQTEVGSIVTCEIPSGELIETVLLEIEMTFDNPENFSILLSNRVRKDGAGFVYSDLMGQVVKTGASVAFDNLKWSNWDSTYKDDVSTFITSSLNTTTNNLINNNNQEILINQNGLRGRTYNPSDPNNAQYAGYNATQVWLTSSVLAFSDDGFTTSKLALGSVETSAGIKFGLVAEVVYGNLVAGNTLTISNSGGNFIMDATGATLTNAKFTISNANSRILLNPNDAEGRTFRIQKNEATVWTDKFWVDNVGDVNVTGNINAKSGTIGGIGIQDTPSFSGIYKVGNQANYYIKSNGDLKWGNLSIIGSNATFTGAVNATTLTGNLDWSNLTNVPANKVAYGGGSGYLSGNGVQGGFLSGSGGISGAGGYFDISGTNAVLSGTSWLQLNQGASSKIHITGGYVQVTATNDFTWGGERVATQAWVTSQGYTQVSGKTLTYTINEDAYNSTWSFTNGILKTQSFQSADRGWDGYVNPYYANETWHFVNGRRVS